jgi:mRNA interferase MazF
VAVITAGQIAIVRFPQTDFAAGKPRPVLLLQKTPGVHGDWLVCMISSRLEQAIREFDEVLARSDSDFVASGLSQPSVFRISRLAVLEADLLLGKIGEISSERLQRIRKHLSSWIMSANS